MVESKTITEQLTEFNKIFYDLMNIEMKTKDEDKNIPLLCALRRIYEHFKGGSPNDVENQGVKLIQGLEV